jgi:type III pantothenate kinase
MKLLIDIGNTRVKFAFLESGRLADSQTFTRSKTGIKAGLNSHFKNVDGIEAIFVANVAGDKIATQLTEWAEKKWQITPTFVASEKKRFGVTNAYPKPEVLGVDRWLSLIAARQHARMATCIIDCGTAITVDIVTKYGLHQGGMILPGLSLMRESLITGTSDLTETLAESEFKTLAINTQSAIQTGTLYTVTATIDRLMSDLKDQFKNRIRFIITGGDAEVIRPILPANIAHYPDIVLKGLAYYARQGEKRGRYAASSDNDSNTESNALESTDVMPVNDESTTSVSVSSSVEAIEPVETEGIEPVEAVDVEAVKVEAEAIEPAEVEAVETVEAEAVET